MSACSGGHLAVAQLLLDAGASVDAAADDGFTALMEADSLMTARQSFKNNQSQSWQNMC